MGKFHMMGMQCLSAHVFHIRVIQVISNQWEPQIFHMDADLMCPAGLKLQRDQTVSVGFFYKSLMCDGFFTVFKINRALDDGAFFSGKRSTDGSGRRCDTALYYGKIFPVHFAVLGHSRKNTSAD